MSMNDGAQRWLLKIKQWQDEWHTLSGLKDQTASIQELLSFLTELEKKLNNYGSIIDALHDIPQIGQLLGQLTSFPIFVLHADVYKRLMTCILLFYVDKPSSLVEQRAKSWVTSQIKQMVCRLDDEINKTFIMNMSGYTLQDFHLICTQKMCKDTVTLISEANTTSVNVSILCDVCYICLTMRHITSFHGLFTSSLQQLLINAGDNDLVIKLIKNIEKTQRHPYTAIHPVVPLCYDGQLLLWSHSLESLEHEVLDLTEKAVRSSSLSLQDTLRSRHLVQACATQPHIYTVVFNILQDITECSKGHWKLVNLLHTLHKLVREHMDSNHQHAFNLLLHYTEPVQPLVNLLLYHPKDLSAASLETHLHLINRWLSVHWSCGNNDECRTLRSTMFHFFEWYITALSYIFMCDKTIFPYCLRILMSLKAADKNTSSLNQVIQDVIESLRCLYRKQHLTNTDLSCVLDSVFSDGVSQSIKNEVIKNTLLCQILLIFCVLSTGGHFVLSYVLKLVCGSKSSVHNQLEVLLQTVTYLQSTGLGMVKINKNIKDWLITTCKHHCQGACDITDNCDISHQLQMLLRHGAK